MIHRREHHPSLNNVPPCKPNQVLLQWVDSKKIISVTELEE